MDHNICKSNKLKGLSIYFYFYFYFLVEWKDFSISLSKLLEIRNNHIVIPIDLFILCVCVHIAIPILNVQLQIGILAYKAHQFDWVGYKVIYLFTHLYTVFITTASGSLTLLNKHN